MESWLKPDDGACACYFVSTTCDKATTCNLLRTRMVRSKAYLQFFSPQTHLYISRNTFVLLACGYEHMREWTHVISCNIAIGSDICSPGSQVHFSINTDLQRVTDLSLQQNVRYGRLWSCDPPLHVAGGPNHYQTEVCFAFVCVQIPRVFLWKLSPVSQGSLYGVL